MNAPTDKEKVQPKNPEPVAQKEKASVEKAPVAKAKKYVTTAAVRSRSGRLRDPHTGEVFSAQKPVTAEVAPESWLDSQIKAGLIEEYVV